MSKFVLPTTGAKNVEMADGSRYSGRGTKRGGRVIEVERSDHVRAIGEQEHIQRVADFAGVTATTTGRHCSNCHFDGWKWQTTCPRCGSEMEEVTE